MDFRCIQCGCQIKKLYVQYSPGNIRLMKCENCKAVADEYIECEILILLIDLILHKPNAYRHLFYNMLTRNTTNFEQCSRSNIIVFTAISRSIYTSHLGFAALDIGVLWTSTLGFLLLDALVFSRSEGEWSFSMSFTSIVWSCRKMLMDIFFGNFMFLCTLLLGTRILLNASAGVSGYKDILLAILVSSYFKIFLIATMVWEFPSSSIFIIDIFVLSSNAVALKVITESSMTRCIGACFSAHAAKLLVSQVLNIRLPR